MGTKGIIKPFFKKNKKIDGPNRPVSPVYTGRVVIIDPFLFDGPGQPGPFFDGSHTGRAKTGRAGPFATPKISLMLLAKIQTEYTWNGKLACKNKSRTV